MDPVPSDKQPVFRRDGGRAVEHGFQARFAPRGELCSTWQVVYRNQELLVSEVGILSEPAFKRVLDAVIGILRPGK